MQEVTWLQNVHQILIQDDGGLPRELPPAIADNVARIKRLLPDAKHQLLCSDEIREFLRDHFGQVVLKTYDILAPYSFKADLARFCYLYQTGGAYIDLAVRLYALPQLTPHQRF